MHTIDVSHCTLSTLSSPLILFMHKKTLLAPALSISAGQERLS